MVDQDLVHLVVRIPVRMRSELEAIAEHKDWTLSRTARWAIQQTLNSLQARAEEEGYAKVEAERRLAEARAAFPDDLPHDQD
jgi:hypothetical protein